MELDETFSRLLLDCDAELDEPCSEGVLLLDKTDHSENEEDEHYHIFDESGWSTVLLTKHVTCNLMFVYGIWSAGYRAPLGIPYPNDENTRSKWPRGWNRPTEFGLNQMYEMGTWMRRRYVVQEKAISPVYDNGRWIINGQMDHWEIGIQLQFLCRKPIRIRDLTKKSDQRKGGRPGVLLTSRGIQSLTARPTVVRESHYVSGPPDLR
ncbi:unnamed protein product [Nippostrongylus brasiliensis]|uniref:Uncharacterized protein n=1 Tax=Nippostrongylus brasiliensis TaxID=27835 RepID=A0A0N4YB18_NIPBR|nr:unnamed protein product [Nippostrongylus brasiliensis]